MSGNNEKRVDYREQNLQLYASRYPREASMMRALVMQKEADPTNIRPALNLDLIKIPAEAKYVKSLILVGICDPVEFKELLLKIPQLKEVRTITLVENDPDQVRRLFTYCDLLPYLSDLKFNFFFGKNEILFKEGFYEILKQPHNSGGAINCFLICNPSITQGEMTFYGKISSIYMEALGTFQTNLGNLEDYMEGVRATAANTEYLETCPGIHDLKDSRSGPCVIVGAGPSLDDEIETLKKYQDRVTIFAVDAAVKPLLKAGIRVDYCTSIERWLDIQSKFWEGLEPGSHLPELVCFPVVHTKVLDSYPGPKRFVYRNYAYYIFWEKVVPKQILHSFSNAGHLAFRVARYMGFDKFILVGMDSAYIKVGEDAYRSHCKNTGFEDEGWSTIKTTKELAEKHAKSGGLIEVLTNNPDNPKTLSYKFYHKWAFEWTQEATVLNLGDRIVNTSLNGAKLDAIQYKPLATVLEELPAHAYQGKPPYPKVTAMPTALRPRLETLLEQVAGYARRMRVIKETLDSMQRNDQSTLIFLQGYLAVLQRDMFFISTIVQNCTRENFQIANKISYLSLDPANDTAEERERRIKLYGDQVDLYAKVCEHFTKAIRGGLEGRELKEALND